MPARPVALDHRRWRLGMAAVALAGLAWRVAYTLLSHGGDGDLLDEGDAFIYGTTAAHTAAGHWFEVPFGPRPFADHPPLTVAVLLPASALFRSSVLAQRLTMALLGAAAVVVVGLLARALARSPAAGLAGAVVAAANPNLWMNDAVVMSESLAALLVAAVTLVALRAARATRLVDVAALGLLSGLAVLTRGELALLLPLLVVPLLGRRVRATAVVLAAAAVVVLPWVAWNLTRFEEPVLLATNDGTTLLGANCPGSYFGAGTGHWNLRCVLDAGARLGGDASVVAAELRDRAAEYAVAHAGRWPVVLLAREGRTFGFWRPDHQVETGVFEGRPEWASWAGYAGFWLLVPLAVLGAARLRRLGTTLVPLVAPFVLVVLVSAAFYGLPRFRLPLDVVLCAVAGVALTRSPPPAAAPPAPAAPPAAPATPAAPPIVS